MPVLLDRTQASLLLIDVQERFIPHIHGMQGVLRGCSQMLRIAGKLQLPVTVSEQYPQGLGSTDASLTAHLSRDARIFAKTHFSCWRDEGLRAHLSAFKDAGRTHVILIGVEAHVCVLQTALDMLGAGFTVFIVADAVSSRLPENRELALRRMQQQGAQIISTEMALTELTGEAGTPDFKALMGMMKEGASS